VVARHGEDIWFLRWEWQPGAPAGAFRGPAETRNLEEAAPKPPSGDRGPVGLEEAALKPSSGHRAPGGMTGCPRVIEYRAGKTSDEVTHFACALAWRHDEATLNGSPREEWEHHSWDLAFVPVTAGQDDLITWWRLPRDSYGVDISQIEDTIAQSDDPSATVRDLAQDSRLMIQDLVQRGETLYALANLRPTNREFEEEEPRMWLLTLERVSQGTRSIGETAVHSGDPLWKLDLVHMLPLHTPGGLAIEQQRLSGSPDGRFLTATTGHTAGGVFLIDARVTREPEVVWGLRVDVSGWYGWDADGNSLSFLLTTPVDPATRSGAYPQWPIGVARPAVIPICQSAPFFETGDDLFLVLDGDPITVWRVHTPAGEVEVQFVGGLAGRDYRRMRVTLSTSDALFLLGDMGCVAITPDDCATAPDPTPGACAVLE
jgi:hypothetical protein